MPDHFRDISIPPELIDGKTVQIFMNVLFYDLVSSFPDFITNRIFWVDAKLHLIGSAKLDGTDMRNVLIDEEFLQHPFAIDVFEVCFHPV